MSSKPLSYESLKCVLQYMEANKRLQVSNKRSSIRTAERAVPLRIDSLELSASVIKINNTTYRIGIYQHYATGIVPPSIRKSNENGGVRFDVDRFGIKDHHDEYVVLPGDIQLKSAGTARVTNQTDDEIIRHFEERIQNLENRPQTIYEDLLEWYCAELTAYKYRRDGGTPPFEHFIQVTVDNENDGTKYIEQYQHNKKYSEAMKQLTTFLFGSRRSPIHVKYIKSFSDKVRLPLGVQFRIGELRVHQPVGTALRAYEPIIHESSSPLKRLLVSRITVADLTLPIVRDASNLSIFHTLPESSSSFSLLMNATNQRVEIVSPNISISTLEMFGIVENMKRSSRPIGTHFSVLMKKYLVLERISEIKNRFNVSTGLKRTVKIPMTDEKQLKVYAVNHFSNNTREQLLEMHLVVEAVDQN